MIPEPPQPEFNEYFRGILEGLIGRPLPVTINLVDGEEIKPLQPEVLAMHADISSLIGDPRLASVFALMRIRAAEVANAYHPATATENELRWAAACKLIPEDMAKRLVRFVSQIDELQLQIKKHLDEKQKKGDTPEEPPQPPHV